MYVYIYTYIFIYTRNKAKPKRTQKQSIHISLKRTDVYIYIYITYIHDKLTFVLRGACAENVLWGVAKGQMLHSNGQFRPNRRDQENCNAGVV